MRQKPTKVQTAPRHTMPQKMKAFFSQLKSATSKPIDALAAGELAERIDELLAASGAEITLYPPPRRPMPSLCGGFIST